MDTAAGAAGELVDLGDVGELWTGRPAPGLVARPPTETLPRARGSVPRL